MDIKSINASAFNLPGSSERFIILSERDFEALQAALEEARMDAQTKSEAVAAISAAIPAEVASAIRSGRSPIGVYRDYRQMSLRDLADKTGLSEHYLLGIETGAKSPSLRVICALAKALDVQVDDLISQ